MTANRAPREKQRLRAYVQFNAALKRGELARPTHCEECGEEPGSLGRIEAHHFDHAHPLEVEWLCSQCHGKRKLEAFLSACIPPDEWSRIAAKAKREGISLRALVLGWLKVWVDAG